MEPSFKPRLIKFQLRGSLLILTLAGVVYAFFEAGENNSWAGHRGVRTALEHRRSQSPRSHSPHGQGPRSRSPRGVSFAHGTNFNASMGKAHQSATPHSNHGTPAEMHSGAKNEQAANRAINRAKPGGGLQHSQSERFGGSTTSFGGSTASSGRSTTLPPITRPGSQ